MLNVSCVLCEFCVLGLNVRVTFVLTENMKITFCILFKHQLSTHPSEALKCEISQKTREILQTRLKLYPSQSGRFSLRSLPPSALHLCQETHSHSSNAYFIHTDFALNAWLDFHDLDPSTSSCECNILGAVFIQKHSHAVMRIISECVCIR